MSPSKSGYVYRTQLLSYSPQGVWELRHLSITLINQLEATLGMERSIDFLVFLGTNTLLCMK
jgi:hypothetical protein